ncbi:hypothetical protein Tco_0332944 [Tanacetum coccineum]
MLVSPPERSKTPKPMNLIQDGLVMPVEGRALGPIPHNMERNGIQLCTALEFTARTTRREYKALNCGNTHCSFDMGIKSQSMACRFTLGKFLEVTTKKRDALSRSHHKLRRTYQNRCWSKYLGRKTFLGDGGNLRDRRAGSYVETLSSNS